MDLKKEVRRATGRLFENDVMGKILTIPHLDGLATPAAPCYQRDGLCQPQWICAMRISLSSVHDPQALRVM